MIEVNPWSETPVYLQIVEQVRLGIAGGKLKPGDHLEPVRALADRLGVNPSTVARAYQLLEHDGVIETNRRLGSVIARTEGQVAELKTVRLDRLRGMVERPLIEALAHGYAPEEIEAAFDLQLAAWRERRQQAPPPPARGREDGHTVRFAGSHDLALETLWSRTRRAHPRLAITASYVGSLDGLLALLHGDAGLAGAHILDEESGEFNIPILRRLFLGRSLCVVTLAEREQGLIVARGNPRRLQGWADLAQPGLRFVNRQPGSGTRTLLDYHLRLEHIPSQCIAGYASAAPTHFAVAAAVADGEADVGLGLYAAALARGLDFVPLARERYDLVLADGDRSLPGISAVLDTLATEEFRAVVAQLGGYHTTEMGEETILS
jgi:molybdate-binding protein/DNA-binding transcriptional regulator YhcF (GntR family)